MVDGHHEWDFLIDCNFSRALSVWRSLREGWRVDGGWERMKGKGKGRGKEKSLLLLLLLDLVVMDGSDDGWMMAGWMGGWKGSLFRMLQGNSARSSVIPISHKN